MEVDWIGIIQIIVSICGLGLIFWQVRLMREDYNTRFEYQKREKAIEISKEFSSLIKNTSIINKILLKTRMSTMMQELKINEKEILLESFNVVELKKQIKTIETDISMNTYDKFMEEISEEDIKRIFKSAAIDYIDKDKAFSFIYSTIFEILNKLETMAMCFMADIAEEDIVYQSLHQVFFSYVEANYILICILNSNGGKDKYYTNIIGLYKLWKKRYFDDLRKEEEKLKEINDKEINHFKIFNRKK